MSRGGLGYEDNWKQKGSLGMWESWCDSVDFGGAAQCATWKGGSLKKLRKKIAAMT
jgi:hypothetical protein